MGTLEQEQVASQELALPPSVQEALGELVNAAKDGLLALSASWRTFDFLGYRYRGARIPLPWTRGVIAFRDTPPPWTTSKG